MFLDKIEITVQSGKGGDGMVHFHREKYRPRGGPDGGDGGKGGDVVLEVQSTLNTLSKLHFNQEFKAEDGKRGGPNNMSGKSMPNLVIPVPPGTIVYELPSGQLIGDLTEDSQRLIVAKGGRGGRGNQHFATSRHQAPLTGEKGEPNEIKNLRLELRLIADVGLVGVPNAGKSSLLAAISNARPKIADYPFTTLEPNLGVVTMDEEKSMIVADIPGLIEGAHLGTGLGFEFLRHIQRTKVLIHLIDGLSEDPISDFSQINSEMALFDERLKIGSQVVVLNKMDLPMVQEKFEQIKAELGKHGVEVMPISAVSHLNLKELLWKANQLLVDYQEPVIEKELPLYTIGEDPKSFTIERKGNEWYVHGKAIERAAAMTYWEHYGSVRRFQKLMSMIGVEDALRKAGIQEGDNVNIDDYVLEWQD